MIKLNTDFQMMMNISKLLYYPREERQQANVNHFTILKMKVIESQ